MVRRYDVVLINLDPTVGAEAQKTRPCVVISSDDMNEALRTIIIAPMTSTIRGWKFRPLVSGPDNKSELAIDQLRTVDKSRVIKTLGHLTKADQNSVYEIINALFL